jgi:hypothetical protein
MPTTADVTELDILADAISPEDGDLTPEVAATVLQWRMSTRLSKRMSQLAKKNAIGKLTTAEQHELDRFLRVGSMINLMQAKARLSLKHQK